MLVAIRVGWVGRQAVERRRVGGEKPKPCKQ